jgi:hypothetical protein
LTLKLSEFRPVHRFPDAGELSEFMALVSDRGRVQVESIEALGQF